MSRFITRFKKGMGVLTCIFCISGLGLMPEAQAGWWSTAKEKAQEAYQKTKDKIEDTKESAKEKASETKEKVRDKVSDAVDKVKDKASDVKETVQERIDAAKTKVKDAKESVKEKLQRAKENAVAAFDQFTGKDTNIGEYELNEETVSDESDIAIEDFADGASHTVKLERIFYPKFKIAKAVSTATKTPLYRENENFPEWEDNGVTKSHAADTYIAVMSEPEPKNVANIVLMAAGQQGADFTRADAALQPNGFPSSLTGQNEKWRKSWPSDTASISTEIDSRSLIAKLINLNWFPLENTFMALVFDTAYYYDLTVKEKEDMVNAYAEWLEGKVEADSVNNIYLAGASRGGCLAHVLAKNLRARPAFADAEVFVSGFDAVCNDSEAEAGTFHEKIYNPIIYPDGQCEDVLCFYAFNANLSAYYGNTDALHVFAITGGGNVIPTDNLAGDPRSYTYEDRSGASSWYLQKWVPYSHQTICRSYDEEVETQTINSQLSWLKFHLGI